MINSIAFLVWPPRYRCPICGKGYYCYWSGNDIDGVGVDICDKCADEIEDI